jgi:hypothetical protein
MQAWLEQALSSFLCDSSASTLPFPPKTPFFRKVCGAVADLYRLDSRLEQAPGESDGTLRLVLVKTPDSAIPSRAITTFSTPEVVRSCPASAVAASPASVVDADPACIAQDASIASAPARNSTSPSTLRSRSPTPHRQHGLLLTLDADTPSTSALPACPLASDAFEDVPEASRPATVLRRPTDANSRGLRGSGGTGVGGPCSNAVKNITEEEYESFVSCLLQPPSCC